ncbi:MAG TPA: FAD-binding oxidoreductase [Stellaceae bacterium]|nr:FAD-binding oxidoreductase [Stellaceae bacterium]
MATDDLVSWGRVLRARHAVARPHWRDELPGLIREGTEAGRKLLTVGLGRSYGDSGLNPDGAVIDMRGLDRAIAFDPETRVLRAEAGISLDALLGILVPRGFFLPVTPGTRFVTLGGAVANDVHGKNHHRAGTIGRWVRRLGLMRSDGGTLELGSDDNAGLFAATIGGLGLTGLIAWVEIEVIPIASAMMEVETIPFAGLDDFFPIADVSDGAFDYTVAWIDCLAKGDALGRGIFSRARHATSGPLAAKKQRAGPSLPLDLPAFALNGLTVRAFNAVYYRNGRRQAGRTPQPYEPFFYPLDRIGGWNRMYGKRGLYQYQSVVPPAVARDATKAMLEAISASGEGSFLAVLKTFGDAPSPGLLSFPRAGTTLALDFANRGASTLALMARLDAIVREAGGRLYPAKDGRIPAAMFRAGYPNWEDFARHVDPGFSSSFWRRVSEGEPG